MEHFLAALHKKQDGLDFPSLEPFPTEPVTFNYNTPNLVKGWFSFTDQLSYGMSRVKINDVESDFIGDEMSLKVTVFFPKILTTGNYRANVSVGSLKFVSKGQFNISLVDVTAKWTIKGKLENRNGENYMKVNLFDVVPEPKDMKFSATGIFPDEQLSKFPIFIHK